MKWELQQLHKLTLPKSHSLRWHNFCMCQGPIMEYRVGLTSGRQTSSWRWREISLLFRRFAQFPRAKIKKTTTSGRRTSSWRRREISLLFRRFAQRAKIKNSVSIRTLGRRTSSWRRREISLLFRRFAQRAKIKNSVSIRTSGRQASYVSPTLASMACTDSSRKKKKPKQKRQFVLK